MRAVCVQCAFGVRLGLPMIGCVRNKGPIMWGTVRKLMKQGVFVRESASEYIIILQLISVSDIVIFSVTGLTDTKIVV